jgi:hypothetical protein
MMGVPYLIFADCLNTLNILKACMSKNWLNYIPDLNFAIVLNNCSFFPARKLIFESVLLNKQKTVNYSFLHFQCHWTEGL